MIELNWNNFQAKFNGKEQSSFEWLCYLLFCKEFDKPLGIFRYKNQAGIETNPVDKNGEIIGWQAKFYTTSLSSNKKDLIEVIEITKKKYPDITLVIIYTNQEFGQGKNENDPQYKIEIDQYAEEKGVEIDWRTKSFFESPFVCEDNSKLTGHFFQLEKSIIDFIGELKLHTEAILKPINSKITFSNNKELKIDRSEITSQLRRDLHVPIKLLSGEGGVGKTAIIKDLYDDIQEDIPFYVFKAIEFNIANINQLFKEYGDFTLSDFIRCHSECDEKYIAIDSAEKLSDLETLNVFQEFLSILIDNKWQVIFTTRYGYLDDLKFQLVELFTFEFVSLHIQNLSYDELTKLSNKYEFNLPENKRLLELLKNPFYLNQFLNNYDNLNNNEVGYLDFKELLWKKKISKSSYGRSEREECFLKIARVRADSGHFFVKGKECESVTLKELQDDEIIKYDRNTGGFFITHDIYEEWALEKIIERCFHSSESYGHFFNDLGTTLPIRRAFRIWLSEKLLVETTQIKSLIEDVIGDGQIDKHWKDEILISVLLSNYSENFLSIFERKLLKDDQQYLLRMIFLLRIACKEVDEKIIHLLGIHKKDELSISTVFTQPKGNGWHSLIGFINKHKEEIGLKHLSTILPLIADWNKYHKKGETTKNATQIALYYYKNITNNGGFGYRSSKKTIKEKLISTLLNGSYEIRDELIEIFENILSKNSVSHRDQHFDLVQTILSSVDKSSVISVNLPEYVMRLANLYWFESPKDRKNPYGSRIDIEEYFCISNRHQDYYPASALQTPIYLLLQKEPQKTVDFIHSLVNKTVECYAGSRYSDEVEQVEVTISPSKPVQQYVSNRLWNMYRGTQVSTHLLESIHMALEKWLLEISEIVESDILEKWCIYLIKHSKSASITAVITSIVLANPNKLFNVAIILFRTKEFFRYETSRMLLDKQAKSHYSIGYGVSYLNDVMIDERVKTCEDKHRQRALEHLAVNYQFFRDENESEQIVKDRQDVLWSVFDDYYANLPEKENETEDDKTWRLYLARMDRRKMNPTVEDREEGFAIHFNPVIDSDLKKYSDEFQKEHSERFKNSSLRLWSNYRYEMNEEEFKRYKKYEESPQVALVEVKAIVDEAEEKGDEFYDLFNSPIPGFTAAVLIRDFSDKLSNEEIEYCTDLILEYASIPVMSDEYHYQISDGIEPCISVLPEVLKIRPEKKKEVKGLILLLLFNPWIQLSTICSFNISQKLWRIDFEDAQSLFIGFLFLKPEYDEVKDAVRKENFQNRIHRSSESQVAYSFFDKYDVEFNKVIKGHITYDKISSLQKFSLENLKGAFDLLPIEVNEETHRRFIKDAFKIFAVEIFTDNYDTDYKIRHSLLEKITHLILSLKKDEISEYIMPFVNRFSPSRYSDDFFKEFVIAEDKLNQYEAFWTVWEIFYPIIVNLCKNKDSHHYTNQIVHKYLFAIRWREGIKDWHTLKDRERLFFKRVCEDIGSHPAVLYSIAKLLNDIGNNFLEDGIGWISNVFEHEDFTDKELEINTIYYLENIVRGYILKNRNKAKTSIQLKNQLLTILNFLVEKGSSTGYLLREEIL